MTTLSVIRWADAGSRYIAISPIVQFQGRLFNYCLPAVGLICANPSLVIQPQIKSPMQVNWRAANGPAGVGLIV